jgi:hypothetical protein
MRPIVADAMGDSSDCASSMASCQGDEAAAGEGAAANGVTRSGDRRPLRSSWELMLAMIDCGSVACCQSFDEFRVLRQTGLVTCLALEPGASKLPLPFVQIHLLTGLPRSIRTGTDVPHHWELLACILNCVLNWAASVTKLHGRAWRALALTSSPRLAVRRRMTL